jgi:lipopolysaccharide biosynthesis glycosyltransferase
LTVEWIAVNRAAVSHCMVSDHISDATYYRLLAPELLPADVQKFIFLDADLLVRRDLSALWDEPLGGAACLAIQDVGAPFLDASVAYADQPELRPLLVTDCPVPNYRELGLSPVAPYFNGGVMVVDLDVWRRERLAAQMLHVLDVHREHVKYWDQYALNVVLSGRWRPVSPRWNQNSYIFRVPQWLDTPFCRVECPEYASDPWIVHFNWLKPWQAECLHPFADDFMRCLEGSPWHLTLVRPVPAAPAIEPAVPMTGILPIAEPSKLKRRTEKWLRSIRKRLPPFLVRRAA